jgi:glycosyltransferase involved in cell wall biosynthesis
MNILYVHQHFTTREGSTGTRSYEFAKYLVSQGHKVTIVTGNNERSSIRKMANAKNKSDFILKVNIDGINVRIINIRDSNRLKVSIRIWNFILFMTLACYVCLREKKADLIFATSTPLTVGIPGILTKFVRRIPFIFEVRDIWPESAVEMGTLRNPIVIKVSEFFEKLFYNKSDKIIVICSRMKDRLAARGFPAEKIEVIHLGADIGLFDSSIEKNLDFLSKYHLNDKFIIMFTGAHNDAHALENVIESARELREHNDIKFVFIGEGRRKQDLIQLAKDLPNVLFIDSVPKTQIPGLLACADLTLMVLKNTAISETACPNKFFDYLSSGTPILINFTGEMSEMLKKCEYGTCAEPDNPTDIASKILELKSNPQLCNKMGKNARKLAEKYDRKKMASQLERVFETVLKK